MNYRDLNRLRAGLAAVVERVGELESPDQSLWELKATVARLDAADRNRNPTPIPDDEVVYQVDDGDPRGSLKLRAADIRAAGYDITHKKVGG